MFNNLGNTLRTAISSPVGSLNPLSLIRNIAQRTARPTPQAPVTTMGVNTTASTPEALATASAPSTKSQRVTSGVRTVTNPISGNPVNAPTNPETPKAPQTPMMGYSTATPQTAMPQGYKEAIEMLARLSTMSEEEKMARSNLTDFRRATNLSMEGEAQRRIPKGFVGARQGQIARTAAVEEQSILQNLANLQAERELAINAASGVVDAKRPVSLPVGTELVAPSTGQTVAGGVFGGSGGTSVPAGTPFRQGDPFDEAVRQYMNTGEIPARYNIPAFSSQIQARADDLFKQAGQGDTFNPIARKQGVASDTASLREIQGKVDVQMPAIQSFSATAQNLLQTMNNAGLNQSNVPLKNAVDNLVSRGIWTSAERAKFNQQLDALVTDYARAKTGKRELAVADKETYKNLISANYDPRTLAVLIQGIKQELNNDLEANTKQLQTIQGRIQGINFNTNTSSNSGGSNPFQESWI